MTTPFLLDMSLHRCLEGDPFPARYPLCIVSSGQGLLTEVVSLLDRALLIPGMLHAGKVPTILSTTAKHKGMTAVLPLDGHNSIVAM